MNLPADWAADGDLLAGRVVLVTGASRGIGRTAARTFAAHGATVVAVARDVPALEALHDEITGAGHPPPILQGVDLTGVTEGDCRMLVEAIGEECGRLDAVLHNASLLGARVPLAGYDATTWRQVIAANLDACFLLTQAALPWLEDAPAPRVLFTSSGAGLRPRAYWGAYAVSKAGVEALMRVFADEADNVSPVAFATLNPGGTRSDMRAAAFPGEDPQTLPTPEALMPLYLWLLGAAEREAVNGRAFDARAELGIDR